MQGLIIKRGEDQLVTSNKGVIPCWVYTASFAIPKKLGPASTVQVLQLQVCNCKDHLRLVSSIQPWLDWKIDITVKALNAHIRSYWTRSLTAKMSIDIEAPVFVKSTKYS